MRVCLCARHHALARGAPASGAPPSRPRPAARGPADRPARGLDPARRHQPHSLASGAARGGRGTPLLRRQRDQSGPAGVVCRDGSPGRTRPVRPVRRQQLRKHAGPPRLSGARRALPPSGHAEPTVGVGIRRAPGAGRRLRPRAVAGRRGRPGDSARGRDCRRPGRASGRRPADRRRAPRPLGPAGGRPVQPDAERHDLSVDGHRGDPAPLDRAAGHLSLDLRARVRAAADRPAPCLGRDPAGGAPPPRARARGPRERAARARDSDPPGGLLRGRDGLPRRAGPRPARSAPPDRVLPLDLRRRRRGRRVHGAARARRVHERARVSAGPVAPPASPVRAPAAWQAARPVLDIVFRSASAC